MYKHLAHLGKLECSHKTHKPAGGERVDGKFVSAAGAKYPAALNAELAEAIAKVIDDDGVGKDQLSASPGKDKEMKNAARHITAGVS